MCIVTKSIVQKGQNIWQRITKVRALKSKMGGKMYIGNIARDKERLNRDNA